VVLSCSGIRLKLNGVPPLQGLIVSNHLSYLDILLYGAAMPCVFVSKIEVRKWPLFGLAASCGGTVFIDRSSRASAATAADQIHSLLAEGIPVLVFPEGTSTDGSVVLRFHPTLFEPVVVHGLPVTTAAVRYLKGADYEEKDLCYYGDIHFAPHLLETMGRKGLAGRIDFSPEAHVYAHRRAAADATWQEIVHLRQAPMA
jgi:1-acyl-sn-glycerol-3-phosphate acyltransferase